MKKIINTVFIGFIIVYLMLGLVRTLVFPKEINYLENRYANKMEKYTLDGYLEGRFQDKMSSALNDQAFFASSMKKMYNYVNTSFESKVLPLFINSNTKRYYSFCGGRMFCDHLVYETRNYEEIKEYHDKKILNIKQQVDKHPNIEFYVYYIEKDTDINFETNKKIGAYEYLQQKFEEAGIPFAGFRINNFDEFSKYYYKTDHHWNCVGSYKAYTEVAKMLDENAVIVPIQNECLLNYEFSGSKAVTLGVAGIVTEKFPAYEYDYPDMDIMINGKNVDDYGEQVGFIKGEAQDISYGTFYGGDEAEIIFDTHNGGKENLLVIGESYDNAILKLLASGFDRTYSIDLRNYSSVLGKQFSFSEYVKDNNINKVLLIGNIDYFTMEEFMLED